MMEFDLSDLKDSYFEKIMMEAAYSLANERIEDLVEENDLDDCKEEVLNDLEFLEEVELEELKSYCKRTRGRENSYLYFIRTYHGDAIKIGITDNVDNRFYQLNHLHPFPLNIMAIIPGCDKESECYVHNILEDLGYRLQGEWFAPNKVLLEFICWVRNNFNQEIVSYLNIEMEDKELTSVQKKIFDKIDDVAKIILERKIVNE